MPDPASRPLALYVDDDGEGIGSPSPSPSPSQPHLPRPRFFHNDELQNRRTRAWDRAVEFQRTSVKRFKDLTPMRKALFVMGCIFAIPLLYFTLVLNGFLFHWFSSTAKSWREMRGGWILLWLATFVTAFPPVIGYGMCCTVAGMVYGMPNGWFVAATANVAGSACSFFVYRKLFLDYMTRKVANNRRFAAFAVVLKHDGLGLLCMIRLCPLPYSFSNGAIATVPTVSWLRFTLATAIVTPRIFIPIFVGSRLAALAENEDMDGKTKAINIIAIIIGIIIGTVTGWVVYRRTKARAAQLEAQEWEQDVEAPLDEPPVRYSDALTEDDRPIALP